MFKGFKTKFPEYEVVTPHTKQSFTMRSLTVQEEENLKGSLVTPSKVHEHLNKCLYDSIVNKPEETKDYESFLKRITLKDRDALLYGLYHITYEDIRNYDITCSSCRKEYPITVKASGTFNFNPYPDDDVLSKRIKVVLPVTTTVTAYVRQPTLFDELMALKALALKPNVSSDVLTETLILEKFEEEAEGLIEKNSYSEREDIIDAYKSLPAKDKRAIHEAYRENFGKYGIELKMRSRCLHCNEDDNISIDLVANFFRMVYTL
jgi:hypothetical protein